MVVTTGNLPLPGPRDRRARVALEWPVAKAASIGTVIDIPHRDYGHPCASRGPEERPRFGGYDSPTITAQGACDA